MSKRAEKAAMKAYPVHIIEHQKVMGGVIKIDTNTNPRFFFTEGYEQAEKDLGWHPSTEHPPVDEEVIVLLGIYEDSLQIAFGHIVDTERCIDFNGWNLPGVMYWMPKPKIPEAK